jgi:hypothetical protein
VNNLHGTKIHEFGCETGFPTKPATLRQRWYIRWCFLNELKESSFQFTGLLGLEPGMLSCNLDISQSQKIYHCFSSTRHLWIHLAGAHGVSKGQWHDIRMSQKLHGFTGLG